MDKDLKTIWYENDLLAIATADCIADQPRLVLQTYLQAIFGSFWKIVFGYSLRRLLKGFVVAALTAWKLTVINVISSAPKAAIPKIQTDNSIL